MAVTRPLVRFLLDMDDRQRTAFIVGHLMGTKASDDLLDRFVAGPDLDTESSRR